jgi:hypothetical protein
MRHFLSGPKPRHVPSLAQGVLPAAAPASLVARPALELPRPTSGSPARAPAVARLLEVAQRAKQHRSPTGGGSAGDDVQCDHGPPPDAEGLDFREDLCDQERVEPRTSRSRGTTEGSEVMLRALAIWRPGFAVYRTQESGATSWRPGAVAPFRRALRRARGTRVCLVMLYAAIGASRTVAAADALRRDRR